MKLALTFKLKYKMLKDKIFHSTKKNIYFEKEQGSRKRYLIFWHLVYTDAFESSGQRLLKTLSVPIHILSANL